MHKRVFQAFEQICRRRKIAGSVLEIGATPDDSSLLSMRSLAHAEEKIGINLDGPYTHKDFQIFKVNSNDMTCFENDRFDACLCNSVLEHDKYFWKTLSEIKRVTRSGGLIVLGTPGYGKHLMGFLTKFTTTLKIHNYPRDYYRFSLQAFEDIFFEKMSRVEIHTVMHPPRIIGAGIKP
ncbi:methyltransferase domain-containing protein [Thermodesulfobacteriota bacterium]